MEKYEVLYILANELDDDAKATTVDKLKAVVEDGAGVVSKIDKWGSRRLAYPINKKNDGYYVLMTFEAAVEVPKELERIMKITDSVVRYMVVRLDK